MASQFKDITKSNATFQVLLSLRDKRDRRQREGRFLVEGVKPLKLLLESEWGLESVLIKNGAATSWSKEFLKRAKPELVYKLSPELMSEISSKEEASELIAVAKAPTLDAAALPRPSQGVFVIADRPNSPGNLGSLIRSAEAFGAAGVLSYGHAADFFDPKCIRASIGALFAIPLAHLESPQDYKRWLALQQAPIQVAALDEAGELEAKKLERKGVSVVVVGNETDGLSKVFRETCTARVRIKMSGKSTSLNAASSGSILLYELLARG